MNRDNGDLDTGPGPSTRSAGPGRKRRRARTSEGAVVDLTTSPRSPQEVTVLSEHSTARAPLWGELEDGADLRSPPRRRRTGLPSSAPQVHAGGSPGAGPSHDPRHASDPEDAALARSLQEEEERCALARDERLFARIDALAQAEEDEASTSQPATAAMLPPRPDWWDPGAAHAQHAQQPSGRHDWLERVLDMLSEGLAGAGERGGMQPRTGPLAFLLMAQRMGSMASVASGRGRVGGLPAHLLFSDRDFTADDYEALRALDDGLEDRRGADAATIRALRAERVPRGGASHLDRCVVCLEDVKVGSKVKHLPCGHTFHSRCIDRWLRTRGVCPVCQRGVTGEAQP